MGSLSAVVPVVAVSKGVIIGEAIVIVVLVALLIAILVLNRRRKAAKTPAANPSPQSYYADLQDSPPLTNDAGAPGPLAGAAAGSVPAAQGAGASPGWESAPPPPPVGGTPPPGTPAGWLPEPSGAPDTLRYWDGSAWTQHVAQRS